MSIDQSVLDKFEAVVESQRKRIMDMKAQDDFIDYSKLDKLIIGVCGGDGIGPMIMLVRRVLAEELEAKKVVLKKIDGLTIERRAELGCAIPPDVMEQLKQCHVILKGPTTTPRKGDPWPNVESANVAMRKGLDLFANVRPVKVPELGIDWTFYRENTEGGYAARRACRSTMICSSTSPLLPRRAVSVSLVWHSTMHARPARTAFPASPRRISSKPPTASSSIPARR